MSEAIQLVKKFLVHDSQTHDDSLISLMQPSRTTREQEGELCNQTQESIQRF